MDYSSEINRRLGKLEDLSKKLDDEDFITANAAILELYDLYSSILRLSTRDPLTGARNRRSLDRYLISEQSKLNHQKGPLSCIMMDIDKFKDYNDKKGHQAGDIALQDLVGVAESELRSYDMIFRGEEGISFFRWGGEEFLIVLGGVKRTVARKIAERLRIAVEKRCDFTISLGISDSEIAGSKIEDIVKTADEALYEAKNEGRNRVKVYGDEILLPTQLELPFMKL